MIALREIFRIHPAYPYLDNAAETKIHIEPTYANSVFEGKNPRLLVKAGQYDFALQDTLGRNMFEDVRNNLGVIAGYRSIKNMAFPITVIVRAYAEEESSDIADELALLAVYAAQHMFTQVGINVRGSSVSTTNETNAQNDLFDTMVNFIVDVPWELASFTNKGPADADAEIEFDDSDIGDYRSPGAYVFKNIYELDNE